MDGQDQKRRVVPAARTEQAMRYHDRCDSSNNRLRAGLLITLVSLWVLFVATGTSQADPQPAQSVGRPNIIVILADDMGFSDIGCYGGEIETPHLDALAQGGLRFTQFYNCARCCPTRASLLTGLYSHQAGIGEMSGDDGIPSYRGFLNDQCRTLAEVLRSAGYRTLMTGKWHVGAAENQWPTARGFDHYWGTPAGGGVYFKDSLKIRKGVFFVSDTQRVEFPEDGYVTDLFTEKAIDFIRQSDDSGKPFFLYLAHIAPHWPLQAKPEDIAKYRGRYDDGWDIVRAKRFARQQMMGIVPTSTTLSPRDREAKSWDSLSPEEQQALARRMEVYAGQIDSVDQNIGKLVAALKEMGKLDNTLILFLSDNGCSAEGGPGGRDTGRPDAPLGSGLSYSTLGLEWANAADTPLRKFKMSTHEGGIATPLVVHWPDGISAKGELRHQPGHVIDVMPTLLEVSGGEYPSVVEGRPMTPLAGKSLVPAFSDRPIGHSAIYWEHLGNKAVRQGDWKAVKSSSQSPWTLYNLQSDRSETTDLAKNEPGKLTELTGLWQQWANDCGVWERSDLLRHRQEKAGKTKRKRAAKKATGQPEKQPSAGEKSPPGE